MATSSVVVHDIDQLETFGAFLSDKREDIADLYDSLTRECLAQERNWQDPQYDTLKEELESFASTVKRNWKPSKSRLHISPGWLIN